MWYVLTPIVIEAHTLGKARAPGIQLSERYCMYSSYSIIFDSNVSEDYRINRFLENFIIL